MTPVEIGIYGDLITADDAAAYYVGSLGNRVARVSARTGRLTNSMTLATDASLAAGNVPPSPTGVAVGGARSGSAGPTGRCCGSIPKLGGIVAAIPACRNALALAYGERAVWVACGDGTVVAARSGDGPARARDFGRRPAARHRRR